MNKLKIKKKKKAKLTMIMENVRFETQVPYTTHATRKQVSLL